MVCPVSPGKSVLVGVAVLLLLLVAQRALELHDGEVVRQAAGVARDELIAPGADLDVLGQHAVLVEAHLDAAIGRARVGDVGAAAAHREGGQRDEEQRDTSARHAPYV